MAKDADNLADRLESENAAGGMWSWFLAEEDEFDRRALWRLGSWAVGSVGAVIIALVANQSSIGSRHEKIASADLTRQSQQIQTIAKESQSEARQLASAIDTLNGDRDRLYARVGVLEQGLDSVTGALARQNKAAASPQAAAAPTTPAAPVAAAPAEVQKQPPAPVISPVATTAPTPSAPSPIAATPTTAATAEKPPTVASVTEPSPATVSSVVQAPSNPPNPPTTSAAPAPAPSTPPPLIPSKSMTGPPDPLAGKLIESSAPSKIESKTQPKNASTPSTPEVVASAPPAADEAPAATESLPQLAAQRTEFGVDVGGANSVGGLRALWRGLLKSKANAPLAALRPIIVIKENSIGLGMQLRLVAGPLTDAAAAAKICAGMLANQRPCETTVFEGQRLTMNGNDAPAPTTTTAPTTTSRSYGRRHSAPKHAAMEEPPPPPKPEPSVMSQIFGTR
jgi:hypothetical protein